MSGLKDKMCHYYMKTSESVKWYKYNNHDPGTCGLLFNIKDGEYCPRHGCENHPKCLTPYEGCQKCIQEKRHINEIYDESKIPDYSIPIQIIKPKQKKKLWITINPPDEGYTELSFINKIKKMFTRKNPIVSGWYAFEWGNEERKNKGIHCHIWVQEGNSRRTKFWVKRNFKDEYKNCKKCVDFKHPKEEWGLEKLDYVSGITYDETKDEKKKKDIEYRKKFNLENIYCHNFVTFN